MTFDPRKWLKPGQFSGLVPTTCMLCRQWQRDAICCTCLSRWRHDSPRCLRCAITLRSPSCDSVCQTCEDQSPEFDRAIAALDYEAPWKSVVSGLKFREATALARPLADLMHQVIMTRTHPVDMILPVPLSSQRMKERGFNQTWLLAKHLSAKLQMPARHDVLKRTRHTDRLMTLDADARRAHIAHAFEVADSKRPSIKDAHIAVVDDVLTTGATLNEVALTLFEAGARSVSAWVLARTPPPESSARQAQGACTSEFVHSVNKR